MSYDHLFTLADTSRNTESDSGLAIQLTCPECRDPVPEIIEKLAEGDIVCGGCGLVLSDHVVDTRGSWQMFANDEDEDLSRVGAATNILEDVEGLQTFISHEDSDGNTGVSQELHRAATEAAGVSFPRSFVNAFSDIEDMCNACRLPKKTAEIAKFLYKQIVEKRLLQWKSLDATLAACILIASELAGVGRTFHEISSMTGVPIKKLGECYRTIHQALELKNAGVFSNPVASKQGLVSRICSGLGLPFIVEQMTMEIIQEANKHGIAVGRSPITIAATALYFTSNLLGHGKSTKEICAVATIKETTIKPVYRFHYYSNAEKLVKQEWILSGKADLSRLPLR